jgi:enoyl-CoA hydratase/carnithine racemase
LRIEHGTVLEARLNRPEKKNALTGAMYNRISELLDEANSSPSVRVVLITAEASTFTSGNDLAEFLSISGDFAASPHARFALRKRCFGATFRD